MEKDDPVIRAIVTSRVQMLFDYPFLGQLSIRLTEVDASKWCKTITSDGRRLFYNRDFIIKTVEKYGLGGVSFLISHITMHLVYDHANRRGSRDPKIWAMATDYVVNSALKSLKKGCVGVMPKGALYDERYTDELGAEAIYDLLIQNSVTIRPEDEMDEHHDFGAGDGGNNGDSNKDGTNNGTITVIGENGPPKLSADEIAEIRNDMRAATMQAIASSKAGDYPLGVARMIDELGDAQLDWRTMLEQTFRSAVKDDYTYTRFSRRNWALPGVRLPAQNFQNTIDVCITIDTSGSMTQEMLTDFLTETKGILETFSQAKVKLWTFDTKVYGFTEYDETNLSEIVDYKMQGGGGTDFNVNWAFMKEKEIRPERLIFFTDGYPCSGWGDPDYCETLFVVYGENAPQSPFGVTAVYEDHRK